MKKRVGNFNKRTIYTIVFAFLFLLPVCANATTVDVNIYSDTTITTGTYGTVNIYDGATVDMIDGTVSKFNIYQSSTVNFSGGIVSVWFYLPDAGYLDILGGSVGVIRVGGSSIVTLTGGQMLDGAYIAAGDYSTINIYGYGFSYSDQYLNGYWADGTSFSIWLRGTETASHVVLHTIPEPATIFAFGLSFLLIRKQN